MLSMLKPFTHPNTTPVPTLLPHALNLSAHILPLYNILPSVKQPSTVNQQPSSHSVNSIFLPSCSALNHRPQLPTTITVPPPMSTGLTPNHFRLYRIDTSVNHQKPHSSPFLSSAHIP
ncbi:hypothetical protein RYX36_008700 [Vicia faba]